MAAAGGTRLHGFAYGEYLEGPQRRSLGYRLLAPAHAEWGGAVEALARALQTAPYPEHWPATELFCSVLLPDGRRLVALARYGVTDQTPTRRRGGLELFGVVGPNPALGVTAARAVHEWLKRQKAAGPGDLGREFDLTQILAEARGPVPAGMAAPVLPVRLWQGGVLVFAATAPGEPDQRLGLLEDSAPADWQWLPLVGSDFPLAEYAGRGPLVAWTPHLAGVALKLEAPAATPSVPAPPARPARWPTLALGGVAVALLVAVLTVLLDVRAKLPAPAPVAPPTPPAAEGSRPQPAAPPAAAAPTDQSADRLALALHQFLTEQGDLREADAKQLQRRYEELVSHDARLRVTDPRGQQALGLLGRLTGRSPQQAERAVRSALADRGYDPKLVDLVAERVRQQLQEGAGGP